jgi:cytochrome c
MTAHAGTYPGVGRTATPTEIAAWDIDVRPDFKGLPAGSGSVAQGQKIWDAKCAFCHGTFGESNEIFTPLVGGTTAADLETGRVAALTKPEIGRTTLMKLSTVSTLWDYVRRAMPWNAPKSLSNDEVYAVVAYLLNLGDILPDDYVLSDRNIADVQARLPNRNGTTRNHGLWDVKGKPDVAGTPCMKDCAAEVKLSSEIPQAAPGPRRTRAR